MKLTEIHKNRRIIAVMQNSTVRLDSVSINTVRNVKDE